MSTKRTRKTEEELANGVKKLKVQEAGVAGKKTAASKESVVAKKAVAKKSAAAATKKAAAVPAKKAAAAKKEVPAKRAATPAKRAATPVKKAAAVKRAATPSKKAEAKAAEPLPFLKARTAPVHELAQIAGPSGAVLVFGNGDCGQLGLGEDMIERKKPFPVGALAGSAVVDVACGGLHTMALTEAGSLWS
ncbi:hypothetical protein LPJ71_009715, partial [Coemansia sp. S17]